jgi:hypothetical protein
VSPTFSSLRLFSFIRLSRPQRSQTMANINCGPFVARSFYCLWQLPPQRFSVSTDNRACHGWQPLGPVSICIYIPRRVKDVRYIRWPGKFRFQLWLMYWFVNNDFTCFSRISSMLKIERTKTLSLKLSKQVSRSTRSSPAP